MLVSIITINYNDLTGLKKTMSSVLEQSYSEIEYIVIDGGSTDGSKEYIESCQQNLAYWVSEPDKGIYNAMNKGIDQTTGEYLLFLNSGDSLCEHNIIDRVQNQITTEFDIYYGDILWVYNSGVKELRNYPIELSFGFFYESALPHQATFIKRKLFYDLFFYSEDYKIISDIEFLALAICKYQASYKKLELVVANFEMEGISNQLEGRELIKKERQVMYEKHFPLFYKDYKLLQDLKGIKRHYSIHVLLQAKSSPMGKKMINYFLGLISLFIRKNV